MDILKDKLLIGCLLVAFAATTFLIIKNFPSTTISPTEQKDHLSVLKDKADRIHENAFKTPIPQTTSKALTSSEEIEQIAKVDAELKSLVEADVKASQQASPDPIAAAITAPVKPQGPTSAALNTISTLNVGKAFPTPSQIMVKKSRPKLGTNEWLVGPGAGADSTDLEPVLKNAIDGDIVTVSPGSYEFNFPMLNSSVEIIGEEGVTFNYIKTYKPILVNSINLKNIKFEFDDQHLSIQSNKLQIIFDNVTINKSELNISINKTSKSFFRNSHFYGVNFAFWDQAEGTFENCFFQKGNTYLSLYGSSKVKVKKTQLMDFTNNAISSYSHFSKFEAENLKVSNGPVAFYGKFTNDNTIVRESEFKSLSYFTLNPETIINCTVCQKTNIRY